MPTFFLSSTVALPQDFDDRFMSVRCWLSEDRVKEHLTDIAWDDNGCLSVDRGDNGKQRAIFAFGDSHAARFSVPLTVIAARAGRAGGRGPHGGCEGTADAAWWLGTKASTAGAPSHATACWLSSARGNLARSSEAL